MAKNRPNTDPRGHSLRIYKDIYESPAFKALSAPDVMAYLALLAELKQYNNGDLSLPLTRAKTCGIGHHITLARSLRALCAVGLVELARKGGATKGGQRLPSLYRLTDRDCYDIPKLHLEAKAASNAWKKITSIEHGHELIQAAENAVKKDAAKLKSLGHAVTTIRTPSDVIPPVIRTPSDPWPDGLGHAVTPGFCADSEIESNTYASYPQATEKTSHRTPTRPPLYVATPTGDSALQATATRAAAAPTTTAAPDGHADDGEVTRVIRDTDFSAGSYNPDTGEFGPSPAALALLQRRIDADKAKSKSNRQAADVWVKSALQAKSIQRATP